jgi:hypothetical protein
MKGAAMKSDAMKADAMNATMVTLALILAGTAGLGGCAHGSDSEPPPPGDVGPPVSSYRIPAEGPRGMIHLVSLGRLALPAGTGQPRIYLHLRLAAVNGSDDRSWIFDPREQLLRDGDRALPPSFAQGSTGQPALVLARGARGFLDLYYPVLTPTGQEPARVALAWRLRRGNQLIAQATEFQRSTGDAGHTEYQPADGDHLALGMGSASWWWNDYYFWHDSRGWWPYPQAAFSRRYPHHRERWEAQRQQRQQQEERDAALVTRNDAGVYWRGLRGTEGPDAVIPETSSWRGTPSNTTNSSAVSDSTSQSGGAGNAGGGDGKSSWRGGSGR